MIKREIKSNQFKAFIEKPYSELYVVLLRFPAALRYISTLQQTRFDAHICDIFRRVATINNPPQQ
jgi:hypothetical protein